MEHIIQQPTNTPTSNPHHKGASSAQHQELPAAVNHTKVCHRCVCQSVIRDTDHHQNVTARHCGIQKITWFITLLSSQTSYAHNRLLESLSQPLVATWTNLHTAMYVHKSAGQTAYRASTTGWSCQLFPPPCVRLLSQRGPHQ